VLTPVLVVEDNDVNRKILGKLWVGLLSRLFPTMLGCQHTGYVSRQPYFRTTGRRSSVSGASVSLELPARSECTLVRPPYHPLWARYLFRALLWMIK